jgi:FKBP-type peptidyl-prolyl cis-trans isomerase
MVPGLRPLSCLLWLTAVLAAGCDSPAALDDRWANPERLEFDSTLNVDLTQMNRLRTGLYWQDLTIGEGDTAKVGDLVRVHLTGWLPDGSEVQTTRGGDPIQFKLGAGLVIAGFDLGIPGMRIGGVRRLVIAPDLAFGKKGVVADGIPPLATLVYEVERRPPLAY